MNSQPFKATVKSLKKEGYLQLTFTSSDTLRRKTMYEKGKREYLVYTLVDKEVVFSMEEKSPHIMNSGGNYSKRGVAAKISKSSFSKFLRARLYLPELGKNNIDTHEVNIRCIDPRAKRPLFGFTLPNEIFNKEIATPELPNIETVQAESEPKSLDSFDKHQLSVAIKIVNNALVQPNPDRSFRIHNNGNGTCSLWRVIEEEVQ